MNFDIKKYEEELTWDKPIEYIPVKMKNKLKLLVNKYDKSKNKSEKSMLAEQINELMNCEILIYPVKMGDYFKFYSNIDILLIEKNKISNAKIISMSYLDFIMIIIKNDLEKGQVYKDKLLTLFSLCFHIEVSDIGYGEYKPDHYHFYIKDIEFTKEDFNVLKKIICYQNMPNYDDRYVSPDVQEQIDDINKLSNIDTDVLLEKQIVSLMASTHYTLDQIHDMTIRKFVLTLEKVDKKLHYQIYKLASFIPFVKLKEDIPHWIYGKDKDKYSSVLLSGDGFKSKVQSALKG